jgi:hypothetical protein
MHVYAIRAGGTPLDDVAFSRLDLREGFVTHWALLCFPGLVAFSAKSASAPWTYIPQGGQVLRTSALMHAHRFFHAFGERGF